MEDTDMRHILRLAVSVACVYMAAASGDTTPGLPEYHAPFTATPPVIDGRLDDEAWAKAPAATLIFPIQDQTGPETRTTIRIVWDSQHLFLAYDCEDADITALHDKRDAPVYEHDCVEVFITPGPESHGLYYGLEMSAAAVFYDYLFVHHAEAGRPIINQFDLAGVRLATHLRGTLNAHGDQDDGWSLEVAIPYASMADLGAAPESCDTWRIQLNRWEGSEPHRRLSMWSAPSDNPPLEPPHDPPRFGLLHFTKAP